MNTESNNPLQPGTMSNSLIQALIDNYRQNHLSAINTALGIQDAHSIWFDLPKLKNFIAKIEEEAAKVNPSASDEDLGIRFYYASYPKQENWSIMDSHPVPTEYAEKHTLVMIPTLKKANEGGELIDYDFNPFQNTDGNPLSLNSRSVKGIGGGEDDDDDKGLGENSGTLIPPSPPLGISY
ncbi:hypothetical protein J2795_004293 [Chryseobacterium bernardetii]|jgi:hypothetical protein|uniref:Uncharacterized protein n=3 Tax=Chryseobacterium TaxID=59732 RepID=A0A543DV63_9FLAO|nr:MULTISPECIES: hypothetical protein [Chryseobacterium]MDR6373104.1 hypothetical protein [Chryseobacterium vietnamense]MDR6443542.1 hypothetical protein [Chryseobacterium bernardetii]MDR6461150.1 hypothetical protein [Chryseobacterium vietnamense]TQM13204.1 hypothetical protein FB551_4574 [Chryseobacterium aquifrigidense]